MELVLRVIVVYVFVLIGLRMVGKREFGELAPFDLVVLLLIPELVSKALLRDDSSLTSALVGVATLLTLVFLTGMLHYRIPRFGGLIAGVPAVLVRHGSLVVQNLHRERVRPDEILEAMHQVGLYRMDQVQWAILETDGRISIIPWDDRSHPNPQKPVLT
jgi:uncharacterized membrane protein YcaP (DUF421 family)